MDNRTFIFMNPSPPKQLHSTLKPIIKNNGQQALVFSPPKKVKNKGQENESPPVILLMQFQPKEYLNFKEIEVGTSKTMQVRLKNPSANCQEIELRKFPSVDKGFRIDNRLISVLPKSEITLDITWEPTQPAKVSESIYLTTSDGHHLQITLIGTAVKKVQKPIRKGPNRRSALVRKETFALLPRKTSIQLQQIQEKKNKAALLIQKTWRGYYTRKQIHAQIYAAMIIQRWFRCIWARRLFTKKIDAAKVIQRAWRNRQRRCQILSIAQTMKDHLYLEKRRKAAATVIQRTWRTHSRRRQLLRLAEEVKLECKLRKEKRNQAATLIQKNWRGYSTRKQVRIMLEHRAATVIQKYCRGYIARQKFYAKLAEIELARKAAIVIQKTWRGHHVRKQIEAQTYAAEIIQRWYRTKLARKNFLNKVASSKVIQKAWRNHKRRLFILSTAEKMKYENQLQKEKRNKSALLIQKHWRGYTVRKQVKEQNNAAKVIQRTWHNHQRRCQLLMLAQEVKNECKVRKEKRNRAATVLQKHWLGYRIRKQIKAQAKAAKVIQRTWRNRSRRCQLKLLAQEIRVDCQLRKEKRHKAATVFQKHWRGRRTRKQIEKQINAARVIQRTWRTHSKRRQILNLAKDIRVECKQRKEERNQAAISIQKHWRGYSIRKQIAEQTKAAITIQQWFRTALLRRNFLMQVAASKIIQRAWRKRQIVLQIIYTAEKMKYQNEILKERNQAALLIQKTWRGYVARKKIQAQVHAAKTIQRWFRAVLVRKNFLMKLAAALIIQKAWKNYKRRCFEQQILAEENRIKLENDAATIIQKHFRGFITRKKVYAKLKEIEIVRQRMSLIEYDEKQILGHRTSVALKAILKYKTVDKIHTDLNSLITTTRMSPESCVTIAQAGATDVLLTLIASVNRSVHSQEVLCMIFDILINLAKYSSTWSYVALTKNIIISILNQMKRNFTNEKLMSKGLTLLYIILSRSPVDKSPPKLDSTATKVAKSLFEIIHKDMVKKAVTKSIKKPTKKPPSFLPYWAAKSGSASEFKNKFDAFFYVNRILKIPGYPM